MSRTFFGCIFFVLASSIKASLIFTPVDCNNGLSENRVRNIVQLKDGRLFITTEGVTNLYDGTRFSYIHIHPSQTGHLDTYKGFHHAYVTDRHVWLKNNDRYRIFDIKSERFIPHPENVLKEMNVHETVGDFFFLNSEVWILDKKHNLFVAENEEKPARFFCRITTQSDGGKNELYDLAEAGSTLLLFYKDGLLECRNRTNGKIVYTSRPYNSSESATFNRTLMLLQCGETIYLLRNGSRGLMQSFNTRNRVWKTILNTDYWLNTIVSPDEKTLFVSCRTGLWEIQPSGEQVFMSGFRLNDGNEIHTEASTLYSDKQGGLWIGTFNHGLLYHHSDRFRFRNIGKNSFGSKLENTDVTCFYEEADGHLLVGTSSGLYRFDHRFEKPVCIYKAATWSAQGGPDNTVYFNTGEGVLKMANKKLSSAGFTFGLNNTCKLGDTYYFATTKGLFLQNKGESNPIPVAFPDLNSQPVDEITPYRTEHLVCRTGNKLLLFNTKTGQTSDPLKGIDPNPENTINQILVDHRGRLWIATQDGLIINDFSQHKNTVLHSENGLINNSIKALAEDKAGTIWASTSGGISRISGTSNKFQISNYNSFDGVISNEFCTRALYCSPGQRIYFGGVNGFNVMDLNRNVHSELLQKPVFTGLELYGKKISPDSSGKSVLQFAISSTKELKFSYRQNFIGFAFSAMNYVNPTQTYYRYKLEGVDENWREIRSENGTGQATYTNLSPGRYKLRVVAANSSRHWSEEASIDFTITPPFWRSTPAWIFYVILFFTALYTILKTLHNRSVRKQQRLSEERLNLFKFNFFTHISHELRTPLTLILSPLESLLKDFSGHPAEPKLKLIYRNAGNLQELINQLLDFRKLENNSEELHLTYGDLSEFLYPFEESFAALAATKHIHFTVCYPSEPLSMYFDSDKMQKILNNLLSNAFKFAGENGRIVLEASVKTNGQKPMLILSVQDNGPGIPPGELDRIFERYHQIEGSTGGSGIGLYLVKEYTTLHRGKITVESKPFEKTIFTIELPTNLRPLSESNTAENAALPVTEIRNQPSHTLLIVEDHPELRNFLSSELSANYTILEAANGTDGLKVAGQASPDLIISDVAMPEMDGFELCEKLKTNLQTSHIPLILLTAKTSDTHRLAGLKAGADDYLTKPFNLEILKLRIKHLLDQQKHRKDLFAHKIEISPKEITISTLDEQLVEKALSLMEKNMDNASYSVRDFSKDMGMERTVLYKKLISVCGMSPSDFMRSTRMKRAAALLLKGKLPVSEVAYRVGYNSPKIFSAAFKDSYGVTPSQFSKNSATTNTP